MDATLLEDYLSCSRALDVSDVAWAEVPRHPLPAEAVRALRYMQDIETHTIVYVRSLLHTRAIDDPEVAAFLACWFYEESAHGRALARFLAAAGHPLKPRARSKARLGQRVEERLTAFVARAWPDFLAVHMVWGAINEITALTAYRRLAELAEHPVLAALLARVARDEARHFGFYFNQAERHLVRPAAARVARFLVDRFWGPVGSGVQPAVETRFLGDYLFSGAAGMAAARRIDGAIRRLPGFAGVRLVEAWIASGGDASDGDDRGRSPGRGDWAAGGVPALE